MTVIYRGAEILTLDPARPAVEALAVDQGAVVGLGSLDALRLAHPDATDDDLGGGCLIPSLIDHHLHLTAIGLALLNRRQEDRLFLQLAGAESASAIVEHAAARASQVPEGEWILGMGWNQHDWNTGVLPTHEALSASLPDHPAFLVRIDAHAAWVNNAALEAAGMDSDFADPEGGRILRAGDGRPSGVLLERAVEPVLAKIPVAAGWEMRESFSLATAALAARGVTEVFDAGFMASPAIVSMGVNFEVLLELLTWADAEQPLHVDVNLMVPSPSSLAEKILADPDAYRELSPRIRVTHIKLYADGAFGSRGAALTHPYADDPQTRGFMRMSDDEIERETRRAIEAGLDIATHAIGDDAVHRVLRAYGRVADALGDVDPRRFRIEHFGYSSLEDRREAAARGFLLVAQPNFIDPDNDGVAMEDRRLGAENGARVYPWKSLLDEGANVAFSSDYYVAPGPALLDFYCAHTRANRSGLPHGGWHPQERLSRGESLRLATALHPGGGGGPVGSRLEVGATADMTQLSANPLTAEQDSILEIEPRKTFRRGAVTYDAADKRDSP
jgi:predicted amidohydrolase YtcJ